MTYKVGQASRLTVVQAVSQDHRSSIIGGSNNHQRLVVHGTYPPMTPHQSTPRQSVGGLGCTGLGQLLQALATIKDSGSQDSRMVKGGHRSRPEGYSERRL